MFRDIIFHGFTPCLENSERDLFDALINLVHRSHFSVDQKKPEPKKASEVDTLQTDLLTDVTVLLIRCRLVTC